MKYKKLRKYKYKLLEPQKIKTVITDDASIDGYITLKGGMLYVRKGYAWDGASGPAIDTDTNMRASLFHDALYQLMRERKLESRWRKEADQLYYQVCLKDGMNPVRARLEYLAVRAFGWLAIRHNTGGEE